MKSALLATVILALSTSAALASNDLEIPGAGSSPTTTPLPSPQRLMVPLTPAQETDMAAAGSGSFSRTLFLNRCAGGCIMLPGNNDSRTNRSTIVNSQKTVAAYSGGDWSAIVACVKYIFAPFAIDVTDVDPGNTPHMEAIVAGKASNLSLSQGILGIAPFTCGYIPNSISYTFANEFPSYYPANRQIDEICATVGQEVAHTWGLDHEMLASDPMTYLPFSGRRSFKDQAAPCGEDGNRACQCGGSTQNSFDDIDGIFGSADPTPPIVEITAPLNGASVNPGFPVRVNVQDDNGVDHIELWIDGAKVSELATPPYALNASDMIGDGTHRVEIRAYDAQNTLGTAVVQVIIGEPCQTPGDCADLGDNLTCVGGRCVPGEGTVGGLGTECTGNETCFSGICVTDGTQTLCGEQCEIGAGQCPGGYGCINNGDNGVCWPGADDGGGCMASGGGDTTLPIALSIGFAGLVLFRRRRHRQA